MKRALLISFSILVFAVSVSPAQVKPKAAAPYASFWAEFNAAIQKGDSRKVASMTRLPFMLEGQDLDEAGFIRKFNYLFTRKTKTCFSKAKLLKEGTGFWVFCGEQIFIFETVDGKYKFTEIGVND